MTLNELVAPVGGVHRRRRGHALEEALLDAAWEVLLEIGYDRFTIEAVADRAHTSRAVLYRRWPGKAELVFAAVVHTGRPADADAPDTGSLRGDVLALLHRANETRSRVGIQLMAQLGPYFAETGSSMADLRAALLADRDSVMDTILARAEARGEIDRDRCTPRVVAVPFDLYRHELLMTLRPVPDDALHAILDDVFLPLVRPNPSPRATSA